MNSKQIEGLSVGNSVDSVWGGTFLSSFSSLPLLSFFLSFFLSSLSFLFFVSFFVSFLFPFFFLLLLLLPLFLLLVSIY